MAFSPFSKKIKKKKFFPAYSIFYIIVVVVGAVEKLKVPKNPLAERIYRSFYHVENMLRNVEKLLKIFSFQHLC